jgi:hypothetical protein
MLSPSKIALAALGLALLGTAHVATAAPRQTASNPYDCVTDDGYGRKRPCSAGYQQKRAEQSPYDCMTDDGYGRKRPCAAGVKRGQ